MAKTRAARRERRACSSPTRPLPPSASGIASSPRTNVTSGLPERYCTTATPRARGTVVSLSPASPREAPTARLGDARGDLHELVEVELVVGEAGLAHRRDRGSVNFVGPGDSCSFATRGRGPKERHDGKYPHERRVRSESPAGVVPLRRNGAGTAVLRTARKQPILGACTDDTDPHATTKSSRSTEHSRSPPPSVTMNDSEIPAPKSSSHIPDWK